MKWVRYRVWFTIWFLLLLVVICGQNQHVQGQEREEMRRETPIRMLEVSRDDYYASRLIRRFFRSESSPDLSPLYRTVEEANRAYLYALGKDGRIRFDSAGDPLLEKEHEIGRDRKAWKAKVRATADSLLEEWEQSIRSKQAELLAVLPGDPPHPEFTLAFERYRRGMQREIERLFVIEENRFVAKRLKDQFSLRRKSEDQTAEAIVEGLIQETEKALAQGVKHLSESLQPEAGTGEQTQIQVDPDQWRVSFEREFDRGMNKWNQAEEQLVARRIRWEQATGKQFREAEQQWARAYSRLREAKRRWQREVNQVLREGQQRWEEKEQQLAASIEEARAELERAIQERTGSLKERVDNLVELFLNSRATLRTAKTSAEHWLEKITGEGDITFESRRAREVLFDRLEDQLGRDNQERIAELESSGEDGPASERKLRIVRAAAEFSEQGVELLDGKWDKGITDAEWAGAFEAFKATYEGFGAEEYAAIQEKAAGYFHASREALREDTRFRELWYWISVWDEYCEYAETARGRLAHTYGIALCDQEMDPFSTELSQPYTDICTGDQWKRMFLDDYQIELIKATAVEEYWSKQYEIASAVQAYALDESSARKTEAQTAWDYQDAMAAYTQAEEEYQLAMRELKAHSKQLADCGEKLRSLRQELHEKEEKLAEKRKQYQSAMDIYLSKNSSYFTNKITDYYESLLEIYGFSSSPVEESRDSVLLDYIEASRQYAFEHTLFEAGEIISTLVEGGEVEEGEDNAASPSLAELREKAERATGEELQVQGYGSVDEFRTVISETYGLAPHNSFYRQLISEFERYTEASRNGDSTGALYRRERIEALAAELARAAEVQLQIREETIGFLTAPDTRHWFESIGEEMTKKMSGAESYEDYASLIEQEASGATARYYLDKARLERKTLVRIKDALRESGQTSLSKLDYTIFRRQADHGDREAALALSLLLHAHEYASLPDDAAAYLSDRIGALECIQRFLEEEVLAGESNSLHGHGDAIRRLAQERGPFVLEFFKSRGSFYLDGIDMAALYLGQALTRKEVREARYNILAEYEDHTPRLANALYERAFTAVLSIFEEEGIVSRGQDPEDVLNRVGAAGETREQTTRWYIDLCMQVQPHLSQLPAYAREQLEHVLERVGEYTVLLTLPEQASTEKQCLEMITDELEEEKKWVRDLSKATELCRSPVPLTEKLWGALQFVSSSPERFSSEGPAGSMPSQEKIEEVFVDLLAHELALNVASEQPHRKQPAQERLSELLAEYELENLPAALQEAVVERALQRYTSADFVSGAASLQDYTSLSEEKRRLYSYSLWNRVGLEPFEQVSLDRVPDSTSLEAVAALIQHDLNEWDDRPLRQQELEEFDIAEAYAPAELIRKRGPGSQVYTRQCFLRIAQQLHVLEASPSTPQKELVAMANTITDLVTGATVASPHELFTEYLDAETPEERTLLPFKASVEASIYRLKTMVLQGKPVEHILPEAITAFAEQQRSGREYLPAIDGTKAGYVLDRPACDAFDENIERTGVLYLLSDPALPADPVFIPRFGASRGAVLEKNGDYACAIAKGCLEVLSHLFTVSLEEGRKRVDRLHMRERFTRKRLSAARRRERGEKNYRAYLTSPCVSESHALPTEDVYMWDIADRSSNTAEGSDYTHALLHYNGAAGQKCSGEGGSSEWFGNEALERYNQCLLAARDVAAVRKALGRADSGPHLQSGLNAFHDQYASLDDLQYPEKEWAVSFETELDYSEASRRWQEVCEREDHIQSEIARLGFSLEQYLNDRTNMMDTFITPLQKQVEQLEREYTGKQEQWRKIVEEFAAANTRYREAHTALEEKQEVCENSRFALHKAEAILEYASSGYIHSAERLTQTRRQYARAQAVVDFLESLYEEREKQDFIVQEKNRDYRNAFEDYSRHYKNQIALEQINGLVNEAIVEQQAVVDKAEKQVRTDLEEIFVPDVGKEYFEDEETEKEFDSWLRDMHTRLERKGTKELSRWGLAYFNKHYRKGEGDFSSYVKAAVKRQGTLADHYDIDFKKHVKSRSKKASSRIDRDLFRFYVDLMQEDQVVNTHFLESQAKLVIQEYLSTKFAKKEKHQRKKAKKDYITSAGFFTKGALFCLVPGLGPYYYTMGAVFLALALDHTDKADELEENKKMVDARSSELRGLLQSEKESLVDDIAAYVHDKEYLLEQQAILAVLQGRKQEGCILTVEELVDAVQEASKVTGKDISPFIDIAGEEGKSTRSTLIQLFQEKAYLSNLDKQDRTSCAAMLSAFTSVADCRRGQAEKTLYRSSREHAHRQLTAMGSYKRAFRAALSTHQDDIPSLLSQPASKAFLRPSYREQDHLRRLYALQRTLSENVDAVRFPFTASCEQDLAAAQGKSLVALYQGRMQSFMQIKETMWKQRQQELINRKHHWEQTMRAIASRGEHAWRESAKRVQAARDRWRERYERTYEERRELWQLTYRKFREDKKNWVREAAQKASRVGSQAVLRTLGIEAEAAIRETRGTVVPLFERGEDVPEAIIEEIMDNTTLHALLKRSRLMNTGIEMVNTSVYEGLGYDRYRTQALIAEAELYQQDRREEIEQHVALVVAEQAQETVGKAVEEFRSAVEKANGQVDKQLSSVLYDAGYSRENNFFSRTALIDDTVASGPQWEEQKIEAYQPYVLEPIELTVDLSPETLCRLSSTGVEAQIDSAIGELEDLQQELFGDEAGFTKGKFDEHVGTAAEAAEDADYEKDRDENFSDRGSGETGRITLELIEDELYAGRGWAELHKPFYDKRMWDDDESIVRAPTIRDSVNVAFSVAATAIAPGAGSALASGLMAAGANLADDAFFSVLDVNNGMMDVNQAVLGMGQKAAISIAGSAIGAGFDAVSAEVASALDGAVAAGQIAGDAAGAASVITSSGITGMESVSQYVVRSALSGDRYKDVDELEHLRRDFAASAAGAITGSGVSSGITTGMNAAELTFWKGAAQLASSCAGQAAEYGVYLGGSMMDTQGAEEELSDTVQRAYDDMGGITLNIANAGSLIEALRLGLAGGMDAEELDRLAGLGEVAERLDSSGLVELHVGSDGVTVGLGMEGLDVGGSMFRLGKAAWVRSGISAHARSGAAGLEEVLTKSYGYGDRRAQDLVWRLLQGRDTLQVGFGSEARTSFRAVTHNDGEGGRKVYVQDVGTSQQDLLRAAIALQHEAYRDGLVGGRAAQQQETFEAAKAHTQMMLRVREDQGAGALRGDSNLSLDMWAYDQGESTLREYINTSYDPSADYWRLLMRADGTHSLAYDGRKQLSLEYRDGEGETISTLVPRGQRSESMGWAASLGNIVGVARAEELLGKSAEDLSTYDDQTLMDVLELSEQEVFLLRKDPGLDLQSFEVTRTQRLSLIGEALLKKGGASWNPAAGYWEHCDGLDLSLTDRRLEGNIMAQVKSDGGFDYSTVSATVTRDNRSFKGWSRYERVQGSTRYQGLDTVELVKRDLAGKVLDSELLDSFHTVDNMTTNLAGDDLDQPYLDSRHGTIQGNTIAPGSFNMEYFGRSNYAGSVGDVNNAVLVINNARTLGGYSVDSNGQGGTDSARWLLHSLRRPGSSRDWNSYYSDGCFVAPYQKVQELFGTLDDWGLQTGYQIDTFLQEEEALFEYERLWDRRRVR